MRPLINLQKTAERLGIGYDKAADLVRKGLLPAVRVGRQIRIDPDQLEAWIAGGGRAWPGGWRKEARS